MAAAEAVGPELGDEQGQAEERLCHGDLGGRRATIAHVQVPRRGIVPGDAWPDRISREEVVQPFDHTGFVPCIRGVDNDAELVLEVPKRREVGRADPVREPPPIRQVRSGHAERRKIGVHQVDRSLGVIIELHVDSLLPWWVG